jgi:hypothetical protein
MTSTTPEFNWSDLQRSPTRVEKALAKHATVRLKRRGDSPLVLSRVERVGADIVDVSAHLLSALVGDGAGNDVISRAALDVWPWLRFFTERERQAFVAEFTTTITACAAVGEFLPVVTMLGQWKNTATAIAAGVDLRTPVGDDDAGAVSRPGTKAKGKPRGRVGHPKKTDR